jgi:hypothetical protein
VGGVGHAEVFLDEIAGAECFASDANAPPAPPASRRFRVGSGKTNRHRLDRGGNRQINAAITASQPHASAATLRPAHNPKGKKHAKRS